MRRNKKHRLPITTFYKFLTRPLPLRLCALVSLCLFFIPLAFAAENPTFFKGYTRMNEGSYDEAIIYFNLSLKSIPDYLPTYSHLALCYERKKEFQKAKETWAKYTEFDSYFKDTVVTHINLIDKFLEAEELLTDNQTDDALPILEEIITLDKYPMSILWLYAAKELTNIYYQTKSFPQAIPLYEKVTLYYPKDVTEEMLFQYAYSLQREKEFQKALDAYKRLDKSFTIKDKEKADKYKNLACLCYEGLGDEAIAKDEYKQAKLIYQKATQSFPTTENAPRLREKKQRAEEKLAFLYKTEADTYFKLKEYSKAMEFYKRIVDECSGSSEYAEAYKRFRELSHLELACKNQAFRYYASDEYEKSFQLCQRLLGEFSSGRYADWAQMQIGCLYGAQRNYQKAISELMKVPKRYPESCFADDALERIGVFLWCVLGEKEKALKVFKYLVRNYPEANYADNAQYYIGQLYLEKQNYRKALLSLYLLLKKYPDSNLTPRTKAQIAKIKEVAKKYKE